MSTAVLRWRIGFGLSSTGRSWYDSGVNNFSDTGSAPNLTADAIEAINLIEPSWWQGFPLEEFAWMRAQSGMFRCPTSGFWAVARHADLLEVERDAERFSSDRKYRVVPGETETTMISQDDPGHLTQRRMINPVSYTHLTLPTICSV